jgi:hypothetical protein
MKAALAKKLTTLDNFFIKGLHAEIVKSVRSKYCESLQKDTATPQLIAIMNAIANIDFYVAFLYLMFYERRRNLNGMNFKQIFLYCVSIS